MGVRQGDFSQWKNTVIANEVINGKCLTSEDSRAQEPKQNRRMGCHVISGALELGV